MILVTGGTGLLGSHLLYELTRMGEHPRAIKRKNSNTELVKEVFSFYTKDTESLFSQIEWVDADILEPESLGPAFKGIDRVYHAAAFVSFDPRDFQILVKNNREGTANIVNACLEYKIEKLVHVSSTAALGSAENGSLVNEKMIWSPDKVNTGYSVSKFRSEMEVWRGIEEGLKAVIVNPSIIFGPGFWNKGSSSMFTRIKKGLRFYTKGMTGYVWVMDVVNAMIQLMKKDISGERYILNSENLLYHDVFEMISKALGVKAPSIEATPFLAGIAWRLDTIRSWFGFKRIITREAVRSGRNKTQFSNDKVRKELNMEFRNMQEVINEIAALVP